jgi:hypothetical protein
LDKSPPFVQRVGEGDDLVSRVNILLPPRNDDPWCTIGTRAWALLHETLERTFGDRPDSVELLHQHKRDTYLVHTTQGMQLVFKMYEEGQERIAYREFEMLSVLSRAGLAPQALLHGRFLITSYLGKQSLLQGPRQALDAVEQLVDMQMALRRVPIDIPVLNEQYFQLKFSKVPPLKTAHAGIILPTLFPGHYLLDQGKMKRIDVERAFIGPSEFFLLTFLAGHLSSPAELDEGARRYLAALGRSGVVVHEAEFMKNFFQYYATLKKGLLTSFESALTANKH